MFQTIVVFECRGIEPVDFDPRVRGNSLCESSSTCGACVQGGWSASGMESGLEFTDIDLSQQVGVPSGFKW